MPEITINYLAVVVAVVVNFMLGFIWYTPLFGKAWAAEMGFDPNEKPEASIMARGMIFMVIGNFLLAWVFAHNIAVWNPETWGLAPSGATKLSSVMSASFFTWLGFFFPIDLGGVAWEKKSWKLFAINTVYHLLSLIVVAAVLIYM